MNFKGYALETGDVMKLGRVEYLVLECKDKGTSSSAEKNELKLLNSFCDVINFQYSLN